MSYLRVKLQPIVTPLIISHTGDGSTVGRSDHLETWRHALDPIPVTHPHVEQTVSLLIGMVFDVLEEPGMTSGSNPGVAKLAQSRCFNPTTQLGGHGLHPVADA